LRVLYLPRYGRLGASSRLRGYQYLPWLAAAGLQISVAPLLPDGYLEALYARRRPRLSLILDGYWRRLIKLLQPNHFDLLWLEYEAFPWLPAWLERLVLSGATPCLVDYDDAIFHRYDQHRSAWVRWGLGKKIDRLMRGAALVTCGNDYLASRAVQAGARRVEVLPTSIDLERYPPAGILRRPVTSAVPVIGWIGSPATVHYLEQVRGPLARICHDGTARLRLIGVDELDWPELASEALPWSEETEVSLLEGFDVGIMPLPDTPWERGKCGYKLIQYMGCGTPVVASPVGVNHQLVEHGINGFLADTPSAWEQALSALVGDPALRQRLGAAGRMKVEREFSVQVNAPRLLAALRTAAKA
jgi:glycosyltransferase involved in cell wall biosynthesis